MKALLILLIILLLAFVTLTNGLINLDSPKKSFERKGSNFMTNNDINSSCRRRTVVAAPFLSTFSIVSSSYGDLDILTEEPPECKNGAIISESAVPGAYQQMCMTLPQRSITLKSTGQVVSVLQGPSVAAGQTGVAVWNSCLLLTRLLDALTQQSPTWLEHKTVVELGCGAGLASISAAKLGASRVLATDGNSNVVELAKQNIIRNVVEDKAGAITLQWGFLDAVDYADTADVIIGSDLTYNAGSWRVLAETLATILKPGGIVVYLTPGHAGFNVDGEVSGFMNVVQSEGLQQINDPPPPLKNISKTLLACLSPQEKIVLDATGGARVMLLQKPSIKRLA